MSGKQSALRKKFKFFRIAFRSLPALGCKIRNLPRGAFASMFVLFAGRDLRSGRAYCDFALSTIDSAGAAMGWTSFPLTRLFYNNLSNASGSSRSRDFTTMSAGNCFPL
jgi:hypothetical protein